MENIKHITVIGLGLLGGSMALALRKITQAKIVGIDQNPLHIQKAIALQLIDESTDYESIHLSDLIVIAVPVDKIAETTLKVLNKVHNNAIVFDTGSIKDNICKAVQSHPKSNQFFAVHPIAGTEFSGPEAAIPNLFMGKKNIICNVENNRKDLLDRLLGIFNAMGLQTDCMNSSEHDLHIAYVSHLSHISSFMLGKTVMEIEKSEDNIYNMAGSGFDSTVRLAKSSPDTWTPIFIENKQAILKSLDEYMKNLKLFADLIANDNFDQLYKTMKNINHIGQILK